MKTLDIQLTPIRRIFVCDCGGKYSPTGGVLASCPPQYPHACDACGASINLAGISGSVVYVEASNPSDKRADQEASHGK